MKCSMHDSGLSTPPHDARILAASARAEPRVGNTPQDTMKSQRSEIRKTCSFDLRQHRASLLPAHAMQADERAETRGEHVFH